MTTTPSSARPLTPMRAVRLKCLWCCLDQPNEVRMCPAARCGLWTIRDGKPKGTRPLKLIRAKCMDCSGWNAAEVRNCNRTKCPLYQYRMGKNPARKGIGNHTAFAKAIPCQKTPTHNAPA